MVTIGFLVYSDVLTPGDDGCPKNTIGCTGLGCPKTCYCEDGCTWERCTLSNPPEECLRGTNSTWHLGPRHWTAKFTGWYLVLDFIGFLSLKINYMILNIRIGLNL